MAALFLHILATEHSRSLVDAALITNVCACFITVMSKDLDMSLGLSRLRNLESVRMGDVPQ